MNSFHVLLALVAWFVENGTFNNSLRFDIQKKEVNIDICTHFCLLSLNNLTHKTPAMISLLKRDSKIRAFRKSDSMAFTSPHFEFLNFF